jgi:hypothetical protein
MQWLGPFFNDTTAAAGCFKDEMMLKMNERD